IGSSTPPTDDAARQAAVPSRAPGQAARRCRLRIRRGVALLGIAPAARAGRWPGAARDDVAARAATGRPRAREAIGARAVRRQTYVAAAAHHGRRGGDRLLAGRVVSLDLLLRGGPADRHVCLGARTAPRVGAIGL